MPAKRMRTPPGIAVTLFTILLPVLLMLLATVVDLAFPKSSALRQIIDGYKDCFYSSVPVTCSSFSYCSFLIFILSLLYKWSKGQTISWIIVQN